MGPIGIFRAGNTAAPHRRHAQQREQRSDPEREQDDRREMPIQHRDQWIGRIHITEG